MRVRAALGSMLFVLLTLGVGWAAGGSAADTTVPVITGTSSIPFAADSDWIQHLCGQSVPVTCAHQSGLVYPLGVTTVACTAQITRNDSQGNPISGLPSAATQFTITITTQSSGGGGGGGGSGGGSGGGGGSGSGGST